MHLLIISGFLGSGKTSILMPFAKQLTGKGKKVVIIENEIGEKGVDDLFLKEHGLQVKEIYQGCICCNLRSDLVSSLMEIERDINPDVVVMEPTGVADPNLLLSSVAGFPGNLESRTMVSIVDAERFEDVVKLQIPLATDGIRSSDVIVVNKIDLISSADLQTLKSEITHINPDSPVLNVSAYDEELLKELFELIESKLYAIQIRENEIRLGFVKKGIQPTVCSKQFSFSEEEICLSELETKKYFEDKLYKTALLLEDEGADLIGNLKLIIKSDKGGYLLISTTSFSRFPEVTGSMPAGYAQITFNLNAIIYGIEKEKLEAIIHKVFPY